MELDLLIFNQNIFNKKTLAIVLLSLGLAACSTTEDEVDNTLPVELVKINSQFTPKVLWEKSVGDGVDDYFSRIKPIVAYDKVYSTSRNGDTLAFDLETGKQVWKVDLSNIDNGRSFFDSSKPALISGGPVAGINKIFLGSENGEVFALDAENGSLSWQGKVKGEIIAAPGIDSGILVVNSASGIMKAFNATNGEELWSIEQDIPALTLRGISSPAVASGGVIVGSADGSVSVYLLDSGQQGWSAEVGEATGSTELERVIDIDSPPLVFGDKVYIVSARGNLIALDLRSGRVLWKRQYSSYRELAISGNNIYLTDVKGHVYAIDRLNGLEKWSQLALTNRNVTGPAAVGNYVVVGDFEGYLHWLDRDTGEIVARHVVDSSGLHSTPTVANDVLYVQSRDGDLQAIKTP
ncbi:MAG: outer membrane protein assembly factor BamB [Colwellia sp.]|nr:outer membrane protein assembly factor BamB [Colwellia sp.]